MAVESLKKSNRKRLVYLLLILIIASIPSIWVFINRWLDPSPSERLMFKFYGRCVVQLFCQSTLPTIIIIGSLLYALILALLFYRLRKNLSSPVILVGMDFNSPSALDNTRKRRSLFAEILLWISFIGFFLTFTYSLYARRIPGWDLIAVFSCLLTSFLLPEIKNIIQRLKENLFFYLSALLPHILLIAFLFAYNAHSQYWIVIGVVFLLSLVNLRRYSHRVSLIYWIFLIAIVLFTINNDTWWSSLIGDEYTQFDLTYSLTKSRNIIWFGDNLFNTQGNFGTAPLFATYIQVLFFKVFGINGFGWWFSNTYLCATGIVLFYYFLNKFIVEKVALVAVVLLAGSEYLISFGKIGYTNLQAFFALTLVLASAVWALRSKSNLAFCIAGTSLAFCFYSFPAAIYAAPLPLLLLFLYFPPRTKEAIKQWGILLAAFGMLVFPLFLQTKYWFDKIPGTILADPDIMYSLQSILEQIISNAYYAFIAFLYVQQETHYVAVSYVDPLTGVFILTGFFSLLYQIRRSRFLTFWLISFFSMLLLVGTTHNYTTPPTTRMFLLLPWWMVFAAAGMYYLTCQLMALLRFSKRAVVITTLGSLLLVIGINEYQSQWMAYKLYASRQSLVYVLIRQAEQAYKIKPGEMRKYIFLTDSTWSSEGFWRLPLIYPDYLGDAKISHVKIDGMVISESLQESFEDPNTFLFLLPFSHTAWEKNIIEILIEKGKLSCQILRLEGDELVDIYSTPDYSTACHDQWESPPIISFSLE